jgi:hypothetical protein
MGVGETIQTIGVLVSLLWAIQKIINDIRLWRGGSPELRLIKDQLVSSNDRIQSLLERVIDRLDER